MDDKIGLAINKLCEIKGKPLMSSENPPQRQKRRKLNSKKRPENEGRFCLQTFGFQTKYTFHKKSTDHALT